MNWLRYKKIFFSFSLLLITLSIAFVLLGGIQPSVEFTGGAALRLKTSASSAALQESLKEEFPENSTQLTQEEEGVVLLELPPVSNTAKDAYVQSLRATDENVQELSFQTVGPTIGKELVQKTVMAIFLAVTCILLYIWHQFKDWRFGLAATLAMLHDSIILIGFYAFLGYFFSAQADILFITAILTILSFSIHDTIVIFDRVRELQRTQGQRPFADLANEAITQTLSRSINNSLTILIMLFTLLVLGGESLRWFVATLFAGTLIGTYASSFLAIPLVVLLKKK